MNFELIFASMIFLVLFVLAAVFIIVIGTHIIQIAEDLRYLRMRTDDSVKQNTKTKRDIALNYIGAIALAFLTAFLLGRGLANIGLL